MQKLLLKSLIRAAIVSIDMGETHTAYLLMVKALGVATRAGYPTANIMRTMNALRTAHGRKPFFAWQ